MLNINIYVKCIAYIHIYGEVDLWATKQHCKYILQNERQTTHVAIKTKSSKPRYGHFCVAFFVVTKWKLWTRIELKGKNSAVNRTMIRMNAGAKILMKKLIARVYFIRAVIHRCIILGALYSKLMIMTNYSN